MEPVSIGKSIEDDLRRQIEMDRATFSIQETVTGWRLIFRALLEILRRLDNGR